MNTSFATIFYLRKSRKNQNGEAPIFLRITVDGQRAETSLRRKANIEQWSPQAGRVLGIKPLQKNLNRYLDEIQAKLYKIESQFVTEGTPYTAKMILNAFLGRDKKQKMVLELYQEHNDEIAELVGKEFSYGAFQRHIRTQRHLTAFIKKEYHCNDLPLKRIDLRFIKRFEHYLKTKNIGGQNTITKYVVNFKKIIRIAYAHDWIQKDPFYHWKAVWKPVEREALTERELQILMNKAFDLKRLNQVKDIFLFSCFTGLSFSDVQKLSDKDIVLGIKGDRWIKIYRTKTEVKSSVPLLPAAETILKKYEAIKISKNTPLLLPVISNVKTNAYLKEIGDLCRIKKKLTFHLARHTFATTVTLANGVPIESVSRMLGHRSLKTTQIYAKVVDRKLRDDMQKIRYKYTQSHLKVIRSNDSNGTNF